MKFGVCAAALFVVGVAAQTPAFEAASIKLHVASGPPRLLPTTPDGPRCGILPGGIGRIAVRGMDMKSILSFIFTSPRPAIVD